MKEKKSRILYVLKYLNQLSDENNPVSTNDISDYLKSLGMSVHRATIPEDIKLLQEYGVDIIKVRSSPNKYFIGSRDFELPELKLLVDAVKSSRFITPKKSKKLVRKLLSLTSESQVDLLKAEQYVAYKYKPLNEKIYYIIDAILTAINDGKMIKFRYFDYLPDKQKAFKYNGYKYLISPYTLFWCDDYYYVIGYSEKHEKIAHFRVDRIENPKITEKEIRQKPAEYSVSEYTKEVFAMYDGKIMTVELECDNSLMNSIIDRFGEDVQTKIVDNEKFVVTVDVSVSPTFYGWVFQFEGKMKILSPDEVKKEFNKIAANFLN